MSNEQNLKPAPSPEEARIMGKKGGIKSGEARRAKRDARETAKLFLGMAAAGQLNDNLDKLNIKAADRTNLMGIIARMTLLGQSGNVNAARLMFELSGDLQKNAENNFNVNIGKDEDKFVVVLPPIDNEDG